MRVRASRLGFEIALIALILVTIGGSLAMIVAVYRGNRPSPRKAVVVAQAPRPDPKPVAATTPPPPPPVVEPEPVAEDLTPAKLAEIAAREAKILDEARAIDRRAAALDAARASARSTADRYKMRARLVRAEAAKADAAAIRAEDEADLLAMERDALAKKRDEERKDLEHAQLRARDGVAVLPYKGANGTWRRPIAIECRGATAQLQPGGPMFTFNELAGFVNRRSHPLVTAVARAMVRSRDLATPDGMPSVPYLLFIVRPDGIRLFYAARGLLEPLGIAFGYELVDADWDIEYPDLDDPRQWSDIPPGASPPAWPPPPSATELAEGSGFSPGGGRGVLGTGSGTGTGTGIGSRTLASAGSPLGGMGGEGAKPYSPGSPIGGDLGRPTGPAPSRYSREETERNWSRLGSRGDSPFGGLKAEDLDELSRGDGGTGTFNDGRVPVVPGDLVEETPRFERPPPANLPEEFRERGTSQPDVRRAPSRAQPRGNAGRVAGLVGDAPSPLAEDAESQSLSEAIARNEGLVAPSLSVPSRSMPRRAQTGANQATGTGSEGTNPGTTAGTAGSPGSNGPRPPGAVAGMAGSSGTPPAGAQAGMPGSSGTPPAGVHASASSGAGGGTPGAGAEGGSGMGWDDSNGIVSKSFDMNVACGPQGVVIYPGGRTITMTEMTASDDVLPGALATLVRAERSVQPNVGLRPRVKFLVKPGGEAAYLKARWQMTRTGGNWPLSMTVADRSAPRFLDGARR